MPREMLHWTVLERATAELAKEGHTSLAETVLQNRAAAYLGAMAHDASYYYRFGGDPFEAVSEYLHGKEAEDTVDPIRPIE